MSPAEPSGHSFDEASLPSFLPTETGCRHHETDTHCIASQHTRKRHATLVAFFRVPSGALPSLFLPRLAFPCASFPPTPLSVSIFPNYFCTNYRKSGPLLPAPLPLSASTPYPVGPQKAALPAKLDQLAVLSRPPTSHLAFYERPRPRTATLARLDCRILRRTIEEKG